MVYRESLGKSRMRVWMEAEQMVWEETIVVVVDRTWGLGWWWCSVEAWGWVQRWVPLLPLLLVAPRLWQRVLRPSGVSM